MTYGIVSEKDNRTSCAYLKSKKVADSRIIHVSRLDALLFSVVAGDIICVISVD